jgi:hypothetical protein
VLYWPGAILLVAGLTLGRLVQETGLAALIADALLIAVLTVAHGAWGTALGLAVVLPMLLKRVLGNARPSAGPRVYLNRLLFDADRHALKPQWARRNSRKPCGSWPQPSSIAAKT